MPKMDGYRVAECMRATEMSFSKSVQEKSVIGKIKAERACPIIAITANTIDNKMMIKCANVGINKVVNKPVPQTEILDIIREFYFENF